jgi:hypothetical protein
MASTVQAKKSRNHASAGVTSKLRFKEPACASLPQTQRLQKAELIPVNELACIMSLRKPA